MIVLRFAEVAVDPVKHDWCVVSYWTQFVTSRNAECNVSLPGVSAISHSAPWLAFLSFLTGTPYS